MCRVPVMVISNKEQLRALSDPTRMKILELLRSHPMSVAEIAEKLGKDKSTIYRHIRALEEAGLVEEVEKIGNEVLYGRVAYIYLVVVGSDKEAEKFRRVYLTEGVEKLIKVLELAGIKIRDREKFESIVKRVFECIENDSRNILDRLMNVSLDEITLIHILNLLTFMYSHRYVQESKELLDLLDI
ncbi:ArsR family transcriptional regulator [Pyrococcus sp. NA2]|uniref:metalloregulator ArsR/SmtB family transcription factor n=1 Tax=Pyrococcus sp. (strain NA2) TaxID=342949 RepID=UPI000209AFEB|nr:metalloregulator ArsR/SmtB family transcription factor [Pyrococcus sp. NA2]AEC51794.1 ArsR family transcriptional regulator [Pyrococcus sp. NA2]